MFPIISLLFVPILVFASSPWWCGIGYGTKLIASIIASPATASKSAINQCCQKHDQNIDEKVIRELADKAFCECLTKIDSCLNVLPPPPTTVPEELNEASSSEQHEDPYHTSNRHNSHYFSNTDLFINKGYNYLKYAKYTEIKEVIHGGPQFSVNHLSFSIDIRSTFDRLMLRLSRKITVLKDISFELEAGDIMAVIYTSEMEQQLFFRILSQLNVPRGKSGGEIMWNGNFIKTAQLKDRVSYVTSEDTAPSLTVQQYLEIASNFVKPAERTFRNRNMINHVISTLALYPYRNTQCGKLSFTERQRVKLAVGMLQDTDFLLLDNIFKDMEIYDVAFLLDYMRDWALKMKRIVIVAMAPPSMEILEMFSKVAILSSGRFSYCGSPEEMIPYFEANNFPCPLFKNPCDYYVDLVTHDYLSSAASHESSKRIEKICSLWIQQPKTFKKHQKGPIGAKTENAGVIRTIRMTYRWHWLHSSNRPLLFLQEPFVALFISLVLSIFFYSLTNSQRVSVNNRLGLTSAITFYGLLPISFIWVQQVKLEADHFHVGSKYGYFGTFEFVLSKILFDTPVALIASIFYATPLYFLSGYETSQENNFLYFSYLLIVMVYYLLQRLMVQSIVQMFHSKTGSLIVSSMILIVQHLFSAVPLVLKNSHSVLRMIQLLTASYVVAEELLEQQFLGSSFLDALIQSNYNTAELIIPCKPKEVLVQKVKELPVYIVEPCSKFRGSQILAFHDFAKYNSNVLGVSFSFVVVISWLSFAIFMLFCTAMFMKRNNR